MQMVWGDPCEKSHQLPKGAMTHRLRTTAGTCLHGIAIIFEQNHKSPQKRNIFKSREISTQWQAKTGWLARSCNWTSLNSEVGVGETVLSWQNSQVTRGHTKWPKRTQWWGQENKRTLSKATLAPNVRARGSPVIGLMKLHHLYLFPNTQICSKI